YKTEPLPSPLSTLTISEMELLYRQRPLRTEARIAEGREHLTLFFETRIVTELSRRTPSDLTEQLKIDYCLITHQAELANLSAILNLPLGNPKDSLPFDPSHTYTPSELIAMLTLYQSPRTLTEREILIETVDYALNLLSTLNPPLSTLHPSPSTLQPLAHLVELNRRKIIHCPNWVKQLLSASICQWNKLPDIKPAEIILPLLTWSLITQNPSLERKAQRLINQCYRACKQGTSTIEDLYTAVIYCSYIPRFSICNIAKLWNSHCEMLISSNLSANIPTESIIALLEVAKHTEDFAPISYFLKNKLIEILKERSDSDMIARIYFRIMSADYKYQFAAAV
ncbi:MAG: hypothetical protein K2H47_09315, partial [Muribaculaceae bacterium]|nr:hypothetical protein [Muribaculaceae bacterium]